MIRSRPSAGLGLTALRLLAGAYMAGHGLQKLAGWFGGGGLDKTTAGFDALGLHPPRPHAVAAGVTETVSGTLTALGLWTPLASSMTTGTMTVAIAKVHGPRGPWIAQQGYEYNATLLAIAFALAASGPGSFALDGVVARRRVGLGWGLAQLLIGGIAGLGVVAAAAARRRATTPAAGDEGGQGAAPAP